MIHNFTVDSASRGVLVDFAEKADLEDVEINGEIIYWNPEKLRQNPSTDYDY
jgi:hypothetical protein